MMLKANDGEKIFNCWLMMVDNGKMLVDDSWEWFKNDLMSILQAGAWTMTRTRTSVFACLSRPTGEFYPQLRHICHSAYHWSKSAGSGWIPPPAGDTAIWVGPIGLPCANCSYWSRVEVKLHPQFPPMAPNFVLECLTLVQWFMMTNGWGSLGGGQFLQCPGHHGTNFAGDFAGCFESDHWPVVVSSCFGLRRGSLP